MQKAVCQSHRILQRERTDEMTRIGTESFQASSQIRGYPTGLSRDTEARPIAPYQLLKRHSIFLPQHGLDGPQLPEIAPPNVLLSTARIRDARSML